MSLGSYYFSQNILSLILVLAATLHCSHAAAPLNFPTPTNLVVCNTTTLTWTGGTAPYTLAFDINGETLETAFVINDNTLDWEVDVGPGFPVVITLSDSDQHSVSTQPFTTKAGNQTCDLVTPDTSSSSSSPTPTGGNGGQYDGLGSGSGSSRTVITPSGGSSTQASSTNAASSAAAAKNTGGSGSKSPSSGSNNLLIGIVVAVVGLLLALSVVGYFLWRRTKMKRNRARVDLLADSSYPRPYNMDMNYGRQPLPSASFDIETKPMAMMVSPQMESNFSSPMVAAPYQEPSPPIHQPTYSEKVAMMRRPKGAPDASFTTHRTGEPSSSGPATPAPAATSSSGASVVYARSEYSSSTSHLSTSTRRPKHHDMPSSPSIRTAESEASEMSTYGAGASTTSLIPSNIPRREADGGVRLAGGPRESLFAGGGTLPPAYGDF